LLGKSDQENQFIGIVAYCDKKVNQIFISFLKNIMFFWIIKSLMNTLVDINKNISIFNYY